MTISEQLEAALLARGATVAETVEAFGVSRRTVFRVKRGQR